MAHRNIGWCQSRGSETLYGHFQDDQRSKLPDFFLPKITRSISFSNRSNSFHVMNGFFVEFLFKMCVCVHAGHVDGNEYCSIQ